MRALDPEVVDAVWAAVEGLLPRRVDDHPLGCHRPRISDRLCFEAMLVRLVTGCSWVDAERLTANKVSDTTLRDRRDEWIAAGVFDALEAEALAGYDRIIGLDLADVAIDGALNKAPCGGDGTGKNPTDRGKLGWKWSIATDVNGMVIGWVLDAANRNDIVLLEPTLDAVAGRGLIADIETLHLDKGYDSQGARALVTDLGIGDAVIGRRRPRGVTDDEIRRPFNISRRWIVERTNSWLTNLGQLRRNTDRRPQHRRAQFALALVLLTAAKLIDWRDRWAF